MKTLVNTIHAWLFDYDLIIFVTTVLATGFAHQVLSKWQTIRTFYPHDGTLWVRESCTICTKPTFESNYQLICFMSDAIERLTVLTYLTRGKSVERLLR